MASERPPSRGDRRCSFASRGGVKLAPGKDALELEQAELFVY